MLLTHMWHNLVFEPALEPCLLERGGEALLREVPIERRRVVVHGGGRVHHGRDHLRCGCGWAYSQCMHN